MFQPFPSEGPNAGDNQLVRPRRAAVSRSEVDKGVAALESARAALLIRKFQAKAQERAFAWRDSTRSPPLPADYFGAGEAAGEAAGTGVGATTTTVVFLAGAGVAGVTTVVVVSFGRSQPENANDVRQSKKNIRFIFANSHVDP